VEAENGIKVVGISGLPENGQGVMISAKSAKELAIEMAAKLFIDKKYGYKDNYEKAHLIIVRREGQNIFISGLIRQGDFYCCTYDEAIFLLLGLLDKVLV